MTDPAVEAAAEVLREQVLPNGDDYFGEGEAWTVALLAVAAARPHIEADLIARLTGDKAIEAGAKSFVEGCRIDPCDECLDNAELVLAAAVRAAQEEATK